MASKNPKQVEGLLKANHERYVNAWNTQYKNLKEYYKSYGHVKLKARDGALGNWCVTQRQNKKTLTQTQIEKLDKINFIWDPREVMWEETFQEWLLYIKQNPNRKLIVLDKEFPKLGCWVNIQRRLQRKKKLLRHRYVKLENANFPWGASEKWIDNYKLLKKFFNKNGHIELPKTDKYKKLRRWVNTQKYRIKIGKVLPNKIELLKKIGFE